MATQNNNSWALWQNLSLKARGILAGIVLSTGAGFLLLTTPLGSGLSAASYDLPFAVRPFIHPSEAVLVYLDDSSHEHLKQKYFEPWNRAYYVKFLNRMTAEGAKAVVLDVVFSDALNPVIDHQFADAMKENGNVILAGDWTRGKKFGPPLDLFNAGAAADVGASALFPDAGEYVRTYAPIVMDDKGFSHPTEAWSTALLLQPSFNESNSLKEFNFWLNYYAPEDALPSVSFYKTIAAHDPDVPPGFFKNKVVFVGAKLQTHLSSERKDEYSTPFSYRDDNKWTSGVGIHAIAYLNLIRGDFLRRPSYRLERAITIALGILFGTLLVLCRPHTATFVALFSILPIALGDYYLFCCHFIWFPWLIPVVVQIPIALFWGIAYNSLQIYAEKVRVEQSLSLYLSPKQVKKFTKDPTLLKPGAVKHLLTALFTDIANFTSISEGMDPDELARLMNEYFQSAVHNCIHATDGTVVKYIGDAIFAFWNAPDLQGDHAYLACDAAMRFGALKPLKVNGKELVTRVGLHTGVANVGNFGSDTRVDYTAIGENINLASRMEGLNKYMGTTVLITADTQREVGDRLVTRHIGLFQLKGFEKTIDVYELLARPEHEIETRDLRQRFATALNAFVKRDFDAACSAFNNILETHPTDGPCKFYLEQIAELRATELPADWKGEIALKDK
ncbi:MAG TPA: adenylate/guanylate cyclase domain-containing protein [Verrucomicrobiae bacterium]|nr:adenylate/guanylate cyclase domain-containing protein [Verrucomicrobiae bacterium]